VTALIGKYVSMLVGRYRSGISFRIRAGLCGIHSRHDPITTAEHIPAKIFGLLDCVVF
jgi:hypothetical protein